MVMSHQDDHQTTSQTHDHDISVITNLHQTRRPYPVNTLAGMMNGHITCSPWMTSLLITSPPVSPRCLCNRAQGTEKQEKPCIPRRNFNIVSQHPLYHIRQHPCSLRRKTAYSLPSQPMRALLFGQVVHTLRIDQPCALPSHQALSSPQGFPP
jgi:hypothetical protein